MSELVYTKCDTCPTVIGVDPQTAVEQHGWVDDDYESHFCVACQQAAADLEAEAATPEELEAFAEEVEGAAAQAIRTAKKKG